MKFLRKLLILVLSLCLIGLAGSLAIVQTLGSSTKLNALIRQAGFYDNAKQVFINQFDQLLNLPSDTDKAKLKTIIDRSISPSDIEKSVEPVLIDVVAWLNTGPDVSAPKLVINFGQLREKITAGVESAYNQTTASEIIFVLTGQVSDQIVIPLGGSEQTKNIISPETVKQIKYSYIFMKNIQWLLIGLVIALTVLLMLMHLKQGRRKLQKPAWAFFNAGASIVVTSYLLPYFLTNDNAETSLGNVVPGFIRALTFEVRFWGFVWLAVCVLLAVCSLALKKPDARKR